MKVSRLSAKNTCMPVAQLAVLDQRALDHVRQRQVATACAIAAVMRDALQRRPARAQAKVPKLCITPLGMPVVPEV